ncbi:MAG: ornithine carbamoyltransferase [Gemmataceae bacterium]|nr:ornithine carbamoyltransferase [Gemmataceae bacterium]MCI0739577.1 ornithine carbamoyltransferase [Gemmataceae bacterium]
MKHFLDLLDWTGEDIVQLLKNALKLKKAHARGKNKPILQGKVLGLIFEKPSLRTRVSFQAAMAQLGGTSLFISQADAGLGKRESIADYARAISQYVDAVVLRTFQHATVEQFARFAACPVINGLSDYYHPCQALGDFLTILEIFGDAKGKTIAFVGDGNNVARSLALASGKVGARFVLSAPKGFGFDQAFLDVYQQSAVNGHLSEQLDPFQAVLDADVVYTDVWASMGQEGEVDERRKSFEHYQVNADLMKLAPAHAKFMHCLPAHRGEEVTEDVFEGDRSVVFQQAGNRMHAQKALLQWLLE